MQLQTFVPINNLSSALNYQSKLFSLGSCFAEHMNEKLAFHGFSTLTNPFGILFNAVSMLRLLERSVLQEWYTQDDLFFHNELWQSYEVHSALSATDGETYLTTLNAQLKATRDYLETATHCILTLGTSWVYTYNGKVVANCHKVSQSQFEKQLLSAEDNLKAVQKIETLLLELNPNICFILTVSPVRHSKDGYLENQVSKGNLLNAVYHHIHSSNAAYYFPAYELVVDELRDYRFYGPDLIHPNAIAIDYVWERFKIHAISKNCYPIMEEIHALKIAIQHRPHHENTQAWLKFKDQLAQKIAAFKMRHPLIEFKY